MPTDRPRDWFVGDAGPLERVRVLAARLAVREFRSQRIHLHRYSVDCAGERHETLGTVEQLELDGFAVREAVARARR